MTTEPEGVSAHERPVMPITKGPWEIDRNPTYWRIRAPTHPNKKPHARLIAAVYHQGPNPDADARAIAAVPALVEAMEALIACHDEPTCPAVSVASELLDWIRAA
jgi:hypothetical protein